ncbi:hypothetical protein CerSpe_067290 [Prunus speciosa]
MGHTWIIDLETKLNILVVLGHATGLRTLLHSAAITTVDWHPTLPLFITGSADNSVRFGHVRVVWRYLSASCFA